MKVLVCGGRDYENRDELYAVLDEIKPTMVISGCARGADTLAIAWAIRRDVPVARYPANWNKHGKAAGPIRNQQMLDEGKPDLVVVFPGGRGTADMKLRAKASGVPVRLHPSPPPSPAQPEGKK